MEKWDRSMEKVIVIYESVLRKGKTKMREWGKGRVCIKRLCYRGH